MRIKDLREPIKSWALNNQEKQGSESNTGASLNSITRCFDWGEATEDRCFWVDVYNDDMTFNELSKKYPTLDWGFQVEGAEQKKGKELNFYDSNLQGDTLIQTDNSKVNENLLKENEELKFKLKKVEEWALERYDSSEDCDEFDNGISNSAVTVLSILGISTQKAKAMEVFKDLSEEAKKELRKLLNQD